MELLFLQCSSKWSNEELCCVGVGGKEGVPGWRVAVARIPDSRGFSYIFFPVNIKGLHAYINVR